MTNNEVFKNILHIMGLTRDISLVIHIFMLGGLLNVTISKVRGWRDSTTERSVHMTDNVLRKFFQGLFKYRDAKKAEGILVFNFPYNTL